MKIRLLIAAAATAYFFSLWQNSLEAGFFMFVILGFLIACLDYAIDHMPLQKEEAKEKVGHTHISAKTH